MNSEAARYILETAMNEIEIGTKARSNLFNVTFEGECKTFKKLEGKLAVRKDYRYI